MLVIGITGGTGGGKTTVLEELASMGAGTIDCDALYHEMLKSSPAMLSEIGQAFPGVLKDGVLDRKALGKVVFDEPEALKSLSGITHKYVANEVKKRLKSAKAKGGKLVGIEAIALIESGLSEKCDIIIGVLADKDTRVKRIMMREGITEEYALSRINAQKDDEYFVRNCDYILNNSYITADEFRLQCRELLKIIIGTSER